MVNFPAVPNTLPLSITTLVNKVRNSYATVSTLVPPNVISNDSFVPLQKFGAVEVYILGAGLITNSLDALLLPQLLVFVAVTLSTYVPAGSVSVLLKSIVPSIVVELPLPFSTLPAFPLTSYVYESVYSAVYVDVTAFPAHTAAISFSVIAAGLYIVNVTSPPAGLSTSQFIGAADLTPVIFTLYVPGHTSESCRTVNDEPTAA